MYSVDWQILIYWLVPSAVRKTRQLAWLNVLVAPVKTLHNVFLVFRNKTDGDIRINGQVTKLRSGLNRRFDPGLSRITIQDAPDMDLLYIYTAAENLPLYLPQFISGSGYDFEVHVPVSAALLAPQITAYVNKFKLASKRWILVFDP